MNTSETIAELLHRSRGPAWCAADASALANTTRAATDAEIRQAVFQFVLAMLGASRNLLQLRVDALEFAEIVSERDAQGPAH